MVIKKYEKLFEKLEPAEPPAGLFDKIILAIKREQELGQKRRLLLVFLSLLIVSTVAIPFSGAILVNQLKSSGVFYFILAAISDFGLFLAFWQEFSLAILESLPIFGIIFFFLSLTIFVFTIRLFLYKINYVRA